MPRMPRDAVTRSGDGWLLGKRRLLCGDARNADDLGRDAAGSARERHGAEPDVRAQNPHQTGLGPTAAPS
jgi:hypothetical protein